jgi:capsular polysaccharide biosynthesis protein
MTAAHHALGRVYQLAHIWTAAIAPLRNAIALTPDDLSIQHDLAASLLDAATPGEAVALLERLARMSPSRTDIHILRASAHLDIGNIDEACGALARAAHLDAEKFDASIILESSRDELTTGSIDAPISYCQSIGISPHRPGNAAQDKEYVACPLPNACTLGNFFTIVTADDTLLLDGIVFNPDTFRDQLLRYGDSEIFISRRRYVARHSSSTHIPGQHLLLGGHQNFGHWLMNCFARLAYVERIPALRNLPVVVARNLPPARRELLALAGYGADRLTEVDPSAMTRFDLLWAPITFYRVMQEPRRLVLHSACARFLNRLGRRIVKEDRSRPPRRYYLTRPRGGHRKLMNEDALVNALAPYGFEVVDPAELSMRGQIELARGAEIIAGVMGAGLNLAFFARPGTTIVQLAAPDVPLNSLPIICRQLNLRFREIACTRLSATANPLYDDIVAPIDQVIAAVNQLRPSS